MNFFNPMKGGFMRAMARWNSRAVVAGLALWMLAFTGQQLTPRASDFSFIGQADANVPGTFNPMLGAPSAGGVDCTGGTITHAGGKTIHTFTTVGSGAIVCSQAKTGVEIVVVAGSGGGGTAGGGGGCGGYQDFTGQTLAATSTSLTIGAKGVGVAGNNAGTSGTNSQFASLAASVGGGGGGGNGVPALNGGCGGGGGTGGGTLVGGTGTAGQGFAGGQNQTLRSGAGGGCASVGQDGQGGTGGAGGSPCVSPISGKHYSAGGGGGTQNAGPGGAAGDACAGAGSATTTGGNAQANTGCGGGGGSFNGAYFKGGDGSDGAIEVSYTT